MIVLWPIVDAVVTLGRCLLCSPVVTVIVVTVAVVIVAVVTTVAVAVIVVDVAVI